MCFGDGGGGSSLLKLCYNWLFLSCMCVFVCLTVDVILCLLSFLPIVLSVFLVLSPFLCSSLPLSLSLPPVRATICKPRETFIPASPWIPPPTITPLSSVPGTRATCELSAPSARPAVSARWVHKALGWGGEKTGLSLNPQYVPHILGTLVWPKS